MVKYDRRYADLVHVDNYVNIQKEAVQSAGKKYAELTKNVDWTDSKSYEKSGAAKQVSSLVTRAYKASADADKKNDLRAAIFWDAYGDYLSRVRGNPF